MSVHADYPLISVIILNWNGGDYLRRCVESVLETDYPRNLIEVIVVDNGSTDSSAKFIRKTYPQVKLIENEKNLGFCVGNNIGIKAASGDLIVLLNNDTIVDKGWIKEILKKAKDPKVGIVGCRLYFPGSKVVQVLGFRTKFLGYWEAIGSGEEDNGQFGSIDNLDYVSGASLAVKREVITKIGLLDPKFYAYGEDKDLCYRARKAGYAVVASDAIVYHYGSVSWNRLPFEKEYLNVRNNLYFIIKHYPPKTLFFYMFFPIKSFKFDSDRFLRKETVMQRVTIQSNNAKQKKASIMALEMSLSRPVLFLVTLLWAIMSKQKSAL